MSVDSRFEPGSLVAQPCWLLLWVIRCRDIVCCIQHLWNCSIVVLRSFLVGICCWFTRYRGCHKGGSCHWQELSVSCDNLSFWIVCRCLMVNTSITICNLANKSVHCKGHQKAKVTNEKIEGDKTKPTVSQQYHN